MRKLIILLSLFVTYNSFGQLVVDWAKAPENPLTVLYTANLMGYKGKPKKVEKTFYGNTFTYHFAEDGKLMQVESKFYDRPVEYIYSEKGHLQKSLTYYGEEPTVTTYKTNESGQVTEESPRNPNDKRLFTYDAQGRLIKSTSSRGVEQYAYDDMGRVIKMGGSDYLYQFSYSQDRGYLKVAKHTKTSNSDYTYHFYYDENGYRIGNDTPKEQLELPQNIVEVDEMGNATKITSSTGKVREQHVIEYYK